MTARQIRIAAVLELEQQAAALAELRGIKGIKSAERRASLCVGHCACRVCQEPPRLLARYYEKPHVRRRHGSAEFLGQCELAHGREHNLAGSTQARHIDRHGNVAHRQVESKGRREIPIPIC